MIKDQQLYNKIASLNFITTKNLDINNIKNEILLEPCWILAQKGKPFIVKKSKYCRTVEYEFF